MNRCFLVLISNSSLGTISLRRDLALLEPSGISTEKGLVLRMIGGGAAMHSSLTLSIYFKRKSESVEG
jgi:hypothetical protein